jgi:hypothetical protein
LELELSWKVGVVLYKTFIHSIVLCGSEIWTVSQKAISMIEVLERKILRKIFGPMQAKGYGELGAMRRCTLYDDLVLQTLLLLTRLLWAGHIVRMDDSCIPKKKWEDVP